MTNRREIIIEFQNYIDQPPVTPAALHQQACSNDGVTIESWRTTWIDNVKANHAKFGPFHKNAITQLHGELWGKPAIIAGSGPSLKYNAEKLKNRGKIALISCLHNFHYFEDLGLETDYYVTLDAGPITIEELSEGGTKTVEEYWALTEKRTLLAYIGTDPRLLEKWRGKILFYTAAVPDETYRKELGAIEAFHVNVSNGGNVLGASLYIAKSFMGANPIIFVGADFAFSYDDKFHAWDSKYDKSLGAYIRITDIFGNKVKTWQSYANFKGWFEAVCMSVPGIWFNATEGGTLGAYPMGNIRQIQQTSLDDVFKMYNLCNHEEITKLVKDQTIPEAKLLF